MRRNAIDDIWKFVDRRGPADCWPWLGCLTGGSRLGHGQWRFGGKRHQAHRVVYEIVKKVKLKNDAVLDHLCLNTWCVNPNHLEQVTQSENVRRAHFRGALCRYGHSIWRTKKDGHRECIACKAIRDRSRKVRKRLK